MLMERGQHPWLTEFRLTDVGHVDINITGLSPLFNWLLDDITEWMLTDYQEQIEYEIDHKVKNILQEKLNDITIP
ncbi:UNVERIFIED_CONTAM: hypothetical protein RMT77_019537 [Armadillidium vulgare]